MYEFDGFSIFAQFIDKKGKVTQIIVNLNSISAFYKLWDNNINVFK